RDGLRERRPLLPPRIRLLEPLVRLVELPSADGRQAEVVLRLDETRIAIEQRLKLRVLDAAAGRTLEADERRVAEWRHRLEQLVQRQMAGPRRAARERQPAVCAELVDRCELAQPGAPGIAFQPEH